MAIWAEGGAYGAPSAPSAYNLWTIHTNEPLNIWVTFWDTTEYSVNIDFKTDGDRKDVCDVWPFGFNSVRSSVGKLITLVRLRKSRVAQMMYILIIRSSRSCNRVY